MLKKDGIIRGEAILKKLTPELVEILNSIPRTGTAEIKITMKDHRIAGTVYRYTEPENQPRREETENKRSKADISTMSPVTQKMDALLKAEDFSLLETRRIKGGNGQAVNDLAYMREEGERVYIFTHEPPKGEPA